MPALAFARAGRLDGGGADRAAPSSARSSFPVLGHVVVYHYTG